MLMISRRATLIVAGFAGILISLPGCASVKSTAAYFTPASSRVYPAKPPEAAIPILKIPPTRPFTVIGRFAFESDCGWSFLRKSMVYNAQTVARRQLYSKAPDRDVKFLSSGRRPKWTGCRWFAAQKMQRFMGV
jgi:hypothetical protein